ncbi:MAG: hypothetical protein AAF399_03800 [Bacteroidota bacterium]
MACFPPFRLFQKLRIILLLSLSFPGFSLVAQDQKSDVEADQLQFSGHILEKSTQDPLEGAQVVLMRGEKLVAGAMADSVGRFQLLMPEKDVSRKDRLTLKVKYFDHVFIQKGIKPRERHLMIELNAQIWTEEVEVVAERGHDLSTISTGMIAIYPRTSSERGYHNGPPFQRYPSLEEWMLMNLSEVKADPK